MNQNERRTSETHPLRVDFVRPKEGWGLIGMSFCPGKKQTNGLSGDWDRNLEKDLQRIQEWGAAIIVSLIEPKEFEELQVHALPMRVEQLGMRWRHAPIKDRFPPNEKFVKTWPNLCHELLVTLKSGKNIFIHCKGGLGRAGQIAAILLIETGCTPMEAIRRVRSARAKTIETALQEWFVMNYQPILEPSARKIRS